MSKVDIIKKKIRDELDQLSEPLARDEYRELLDELASEIQCRQDCMKEEDEA